MDSIRKIVRQVISESLIKETTKATFKAYHGSDHDITKFTDEFLKDDKNIQHHGAGIYFTTSYENARMFGNIIYEVEISGNFIDKNNPVGDVDMDDLMALMKLSDEEWELEAQNYSPDPEHGLWIAANDAMEQGNEADAFIRIQNGWYMYDPIGYVRAMTKLGFDGMIVNAPRDWVGHKHIILFNPEAVKIIGKEKKENLDESSSVGGDVWYHGTPDVREVEKEGGFTERFLTIDYVEDPDEWDRRQQALADARAAGSYPGSDDSSEYFKILDTVGELRKKAKIRKPIFLTDVYSVARTYADPQRAFDYQNAEEKVLRVRFKGGKGVTINAPGQRFRFIDIEPVRRGFINAGVDPDELDLIIRKLNFAQGTKNGIKTDDIAAIGNWLGFDYIDVKGVLDSYQGGSVKSTVRMVFDPSHIEIVRGNIQESIFKEFDQYLSEVFSINESDEPSPTFEWDIAKEKIDRSKRGIKTKSQAYEYFLNLLNRVKNIPGAIKTRIVKYVALSLIVLLGGVTVKQMVSEKVPEISHEIVTAVNNMQPEEVEEVWENPRRSSDALEEFLKYEEGSIKHKGQPVLKAYKLGDGMITVGWGHAERIGDSKLRKGDVITVDQAEQLLKDDIAEAELYLNNILDKWEEEGVDIKIDQGMYDAMTSMIFNMGIGNFRKSDFIQLVKQGKNEEAAEKILTTNVTYPGHVPRREKEKEMFSGASEQLAMNEVRKMVRNTLSQLF